jgi:hypothetical protein
MYLGYHDNDISSRGNFGRLRGFLWCEGAMQFWHPKRNSEAVLPPPNSCLSIGLNRSRHQSAALSSINAPPQPPINRQTNVAGFGRAIGGQPLIKKPLGERAGYPLLSKI